jgi:hypothetical protein
VVTVGFCSVELKLLGPAHDHDVAIPDPSTPLSVRMLEVHIGFSDGVAVTEVGTVFTVTVALVAVTVPQLLMADNV